MRQRSARSCQCGQILLRHTNESSCIIITMASICFHPSCAPVLCAPCYFCRLCCSCGRTAWNQQIYARARRQHQRDWLIQYRWIGSCPCCYSPQQWPGEEARRQRCCHECCLVVPLPIVSYDYFILPLPLLIILCNKTPFWSTLVTQIHGSVLTRRTKSLAPLIRLVTL